MLYVLYYMDLRNMKFADLASKKFLFLKSGSHLPKKICFICFNESPLKMMKNAFYFILKAFFVLKIFKFLSQRFGHVEKTAWLERYNWFQNLWRHSVVNKQLQYTHYPISYEVKGNQTMKFGQFIKYSKKNIFLQKSCRKWGRETSSRPLFVF